jgi:hypothetical protein
MRPAEEEKKVRHRQLEAIRRMDDDTLLMAHAYGYQDPNIDTGNIPVNAALESRLLTRLSDQTR